MDSSRLAGAFRIGEFAFTRVAPGSRRQLSDPTRGLPYMELVIRGHFSEFVQRREIQLRPGSALFRPAASGRPARYPTGAELLFIVVPPTRALARVVVERTARAWALNLLREVQVRDVGWESIVEGLAIEGLGHMARQESLSRARPAWLDDAVDLAIDQRPLAEIGVRLGLHSSHVARVFRRHEGVSAGEYARRCRLELAALSLRTTDEALASLAERAGFFDQSHFTNAFKQVFHVTPAEYRRSMTTRAPS